MSFVLHDFELSPKVLRYTSFELNGLSLKPKIIYRIHTNSAPVYYFPARHFGGSSNRIFRRGSFIGEGLVIPMKKEFGKGGLVLWYIIAYFAKNLTAIFLIIA